MTNKTILMIDDDEISLLILQNALEIAGFDVFITTDSSNAKTLFNKINPQVVILDIFMPEKDGFEVIKELRALSEECVIIAISGNERYLPAIKALGANTAVPKSAHPNVLVDIVKAL